MPAGGVKKKMAKFGGVTYTELPGSPQEGYSGGQGKITRTYLCAWNDRWKFASALLGRSIVATSPATNTFPSGRKFIKRQLPDGYAVNVNTGDVTGTGNAWLYATGVDRIEGIGVPQRAVGSASAVLKDDADNYLYEKAKLTVQYESILFTVHTDAEMIDPAGVLLPDGSKFTGYRTIGTGVVSGVTEKLIDESSCLRYVSRHVQPTVEHVRLPFGKMLWTSDSKPAVNGVGKLVSTQEVQFTWHATPKVPINNIGQILGKVNQNTFTDTTPGGYGKYAYPPWTLLLVAAEFKPYRQIGGTYVADVTYRMKHVLNTTVYGDGAFVAGSYLGHRGFIRFTGTGATAQYDIQTMRTTGSTLDGSVPTKTRYVYDAADFTKLFDINDDYVPPDGEG